MLDIGFLSSYPLTNARGSVSRHVAISEPRALARGDADKKPYAKPIHIDLRDILFAIVFQTCITYNNLTPFQ